MTVPGLLAQHEREELEGNMRALLLVHGPLELLHAVEAALRDAAFDKRTAEGFDKCPAPVVMSLFRAAELLREAGAIFEVGAEEPTT